MMYKDNKLLDMLDKALLKLGLMRSSVNKSQIECYKTYTKKLGEAAKDAGVKVLFERETLIGVEIDSDLFIMGNGNYIVNCWFTRSMVQVAPQCYNNYLYGNSFTNGNPVEFHNFIIKLEDNK